MTRFHNDTDETAWTDEREAMEQESQENLAAYYAERTFRLENRAGAFFEVVDEDTSDGRVWIRSFLTPDGEHRTRAWARNHWAYLLKIGYWRTDANARADHRNDAASEAWDHEHGI